MEDLKTSIRELISMNPDKIWGIRLQLGHKTKDRILYTFDDCINWIMASDKNSLQFWFDNGTFDGDTISIFKSEFI